jgi:hypothetical protein
MAYVTAIKYARPQNQTCSFGDLIAFRAADIIRREFESGSQEFPLITQLIADCEESAKQNEEQSRLWAAPFCNAFYRQLKRTYWSAWPCCCFNLIGNQRSILSKLAARVSQITKAHNDDQLVQNLTSLSELSDVIHVVGDRRNLCARAEGDTLRGLRSWQIDCVQMLVKERAAELERKQQEEMIRLASSPPPVFYVLVQNQPPAPCAYPVVAEEKSESNPYHQPAPPNPYQESPYQKESTTQAQPVAVNPYQEKVGQPTPEPTSGQPAPEPTVNPYQSTQ